MNYLKYTIIFICLFALGFKFFTTPSSTKQYTFIESIDGRVITPTDVYYLAKSIDNSLITKYSLHSKFIRPLITNNANPRNVYQKAISLAEEFAQIHPKIFGENPLNLGALNSLKQYAGDNIQPKHVYSVVHLTKQQLILEGSYIEYLGVKEEKTPSDVFQMLRQISFHHIEIIQQQSALKWNKPVRVFEINLFEIYPLLHHIAKNNNIDLKDYSFPLKSTENIRPIDVYRAQLELHGLLEKYYFLKKQDYKPVEFLTPSDNNNINPGDVYDLSRIILGEFKSFEGGSGKLKKEVSVQYYNWKNKKGSIVPGDVYNLVQYNVFILKKILSKMEITF